MILRRLPGERFSEVVREWEGQTVAVIGGGPSLTLTDVAAVAGFKVIAVNDAYLWAPRSDVCYAADSHWHHWNESGVYQTEHGSLPYEKPALGLRASDVRERWASFSGQKCSIQGSGANITDPAVHILRNKTYPSHGAGLSLDQRALMTGHNSGFQALNLAILAGAQTVILLGMDGQPAADGRTHFSGGHPRPTPPEAYTEYRKAFAAARKAIGELGVRVINCSPGSAVTAFEKMTLEDALACVPA